MNRRGFFALLGGAALAPMSAVARPTITRRGLLITEGQSVSIPTAPGMVIDFTRGIYRIGGCAYADFMDMPGVRFRPT